MVAVVVLAALLSGCYVGPEGTPKVLFLGDEYLGQAQQAIQADISTDHQVAFASKGGATLADLEEMAETWVGTAPAQVVIDAGANDVLGAVPFEDSVAALRRVVEVFPVTTCISFVGLGGRPPDGLVDLRQAAMNRELQRMLDTMPNVNWVGWDGAVVWHPTTLEPLVGGPQGYDRTALGVDHFRQTVRAAVDFCERPTSVEVVLYDDLDGDGGRDPGEPGVPGMQIGIGPDLADPPSYEPVQVWISDTDGAVRFLVPAGRYVGVLEYALAAPSRSLAPGESVRIEIPTSGGAPDVVAMGDSLVWGAMPELRARLGTAHRISIRGVSLSRLGEHRDAADAYAAAGPTHVVIDLGSNDAQLGWPIADTEADLADLVGRFASVPCLHLTTVNTNRPGDPVFEERAEAVNDLIRAVVAERPGARLIDWDAEVEAAADPLVLLQSDHLHRTDTGDERYAELAEASLATCS